MQDFSGFYKLTTDERMKRIKVAAKLTDEEVKALQNSGALSLAQADKTVENVIGAIHLPLGIGTNFVINGKAIPVPMAIEEPSVIAAASKGAKLTLPAGFKAEADESIMMGQIQLVNIPDMDLALKDIELNRHEILSMASVPMKPNERYGCAVKGFTHKIIQTNRGQMLIVEFQICVGDAQGANMVNSTLEAVAPALVRLTGGKIRLRILSNLATFRKVQASSVWKKDVVGDAVIEGVLDAYEFAVNDIYRCATHNKGIMNGIDAVVLATGNDWRSAEAGAHSFASLGAYHSLTQYYKNEKGDLVGSIELPLALGIVGPAVNSSPTAKIALKIMGVKSSRELAMVMACVGLSNNFSALAALSTVGIQEGHMMLHARSVAAQVGAVDAEAEMVAEILAKDKNFSLEYAKQVLERARKK